MTKTYCFTNRSVIFGLGLSLIFASCAVSTDEPESAPTEPVEAATEGGQPEQVTSPDADVMYEVLSGEVLGADGQTSESAFAYLEAAMNSEDPAIAARATRIALAAQEWQLAAMAADRWALLQPGNIDARRTAARAMIVVGDYMGAEHQLSQLISVMSSDLTRAWSIVAEVLSTAGNREKVQLVLAGLVSAHDAGQSPDALFARSVVAGRNGDLAGALALAGQGLEIDDSRADLHAWAGRLSVNLDQQERALEHYRAAWKLNREDRRIAMAYAELLRRNEKGKEAQQILAELPDSPEVRFARVAFALDTEFTEMANEIYEGFSTAEYAGEIEAAFQAAQAAELLGRPEDAIDWYRKVHEGPRLLVAVLRRAYLTADQGRIDEARALLSDIRNRQGEEFRTESFIAESEILVNDGQVENAIELLDSAVRQHQPDTRLLYSKAMLGVQLDRLDLAEKDLRRIIEIDPANATALNALGYTLADRTTRLEEAESLIRSAYELQPEESSIIDSMGWVAFRLGRLDEAERYLRDAWSRDRNAEIGAHLGEVLWASERNEEALVIWREALSVDPSNAVLQQTLDRFGVEL